MDGGSTDGSVDILKRYTRHFAHWESKPDKGQADAILRGLKSATGEILCYLNSDDLLLPGCLFKVSEHFRKYPSGSGVVGGTILIGPDGKPKRDRLGLPQCDLGTRVSFKKLLLWKCGGFSQPAAFWSKRAFEAAGGFDTSLHFSLDYDIFLRLARLAPFGRIRDFLACFRIHEDSKTTRLQEVRAKEDQRIWADFGRFKYPAWYRGLFWHSCELNQQFQRRLMQAALILGLVRTPNL
jgi:glycosyltransferase involved in cell wall biosynthesis